VKIRSICNRNVASVTSGASVLDVATVMHRERVGSVIVTDNARGCPHVLGIVTDRDIVLAQLEHVASFAELSIASIMSSCPFLLHEDEDTAQAMQKLRERSIRRAPVVNDQQELIGVVSVDDLLSQLAKDIRALAGVVERQRHA
jgi:CBS domain-containing protein